MKIIVDEPADYKKWLATQPKLVKQIAEEKAANAPKSVEAVVPKADTLKVIMPAAVVAVKK